MQFWIFHKIHQNTSKEQSCVLRVKMNICKFLNIFIWFLIPKLVYKSAFTFCLTVMVKKLQMVKNWPKSQFGPFLTICNFLTITLRNKGKALLYTKLCMRNQIILFRNLQMFIFTLKTLFCSFGIFWGFMKHLKSHFMWANDGIFKI